MLRKDLNFKINLFNNNTEMRTGPMSARSYFSL